MYEITQSNTEKYFEATVSAQKEVKERIEYYMREMIQISGGKIEKVELLLSAAMLSVETGLVQLKFNAGMHGHHSLMDKLQTTKA